MHKNFQVVYLKADMTENNSSGIPNELLIKNKSFSRIEDISSLKQYENLKSNLSNTVSLVSGTELSENRRGSNQGNTLDRVLKPLNYSS